MAKNNVIVKKFSKISENSFLKNGSQMAQNF